MGALVFLFAFHWSRDPSVNRSSFFDMHAPRQPHTVTYQLSDMWLFPSILVPFLSYWYGESTSYVFPFRMVFFYNLWPRAGFLTSAYEGIQNKKMAMPAHLRALFCSGPCRANIHVLSAVHVAGCVVSGTVRRCFQTCLLFHTVQL